MKKVYPDFRIKRTNIFVSSGLMGGFKDALDKTVDILQYKDENEGWVNLPIHYENIRVFKNGIESDAY